MGLRRLLKHTIRPYRSATDVCAQKGRSIQQRARSARLNSSGSPSGMSSSSSWCVCSHTGIARIRIACPLLVSCRVRLLRSDGSAEILTKPRLSNGFKAAVSVVRSMASRDATGPIGGGAGRFSAMSRENCPFVRSNGRSTSSKRRANARAARCTCKHRQQSRTSNVVSYGSVFLLDTPSP